MRILMDECVPRRLRDQFPGHDVRTVPEMGWFGIKNGRLISLMQGHGFEVFLTVDQNVSFQQNLAMVPVAVLVFVAFTNRLDDMAPLVPSAMQVLTTIKPGDIVEIRT
jgi:hypothetical protein